MHRIGYRNNTFTYHMIDLCTSVPTLRAREDQMSLLSMMLLSPRYCRRCLPSAIMARSLLWQVGEWTHVHLSSSGTHKSDLFGKLVFCQQNDDDDLDMRLPCSTGGCVSPCPQAQPLGRKGSRQIQSQSERHRKFKASPGYIAQTCLNTIAKSSWSIGDT